LSTDSSAISIALLFHAIKAREARPDAPPARRGLKTNYTDSELTDLIRPEIAASPFHGEGHRKIWVRLRYKGIRTTGYRFAPATASSKRPRGLSLGARASLAGDSA
jgi:hypothetical protein